MRTRTRKRNRAIPSMNIGAATTFYGYLAQNVPNDVHFAMNRFAHYPKAKSDKEQEEQMKHFVRNYGDNALKELAKVHPDLQLIQSINSSKNVSKESLLNYDGCGCDEGKNDSNCGCEYYTGSDGILTKDKSNCRVHGGRREHANFIDKGSDYATLFVVGAACIMLGVYLKK